MFKISLRTIAASIAIPVILAACGSPAPSTTAESDVSSQPISSPESSTSTPTTAVVPLATPPSISTAAPDSVTPQEIAANSLAATLKMDSVSFDMDFAMSLAFPSDGQVRSMNMQYTATSSVNIPLKQMDMDLDMTMDVPEQGTQNMSASMYSMDGWLYMKTAVPVLGDQWTKMQLTDELWAAQSQFSSMTDFLDAPINVELIRSEKVGGVDCYVLDITPDVNTLADWMAGEMQSGQAAPDLGGFDLSSMSQILAVKQWVAKDTYLPVRQQVHIKFDSSSLPGTASGMSMDMSVSLDYHDYGKPVTIQLPPEALNATEIPMQQ